MTSALHLAISRHHTALRPNTAPRCVLSASYRLTSTRPRTFFGIYIIIQIISNSAHNYTNKYNITKNDKEQLFRSFLVQFLPCLALVVVRFFHDKQSPFNCLGLSPTLLPLSSLPLSLLLSSAPFQSSSEHPHSTRGAAQALGAGQEDVSLSAMADLAVGEGTRHPRLTQCCSGHMPFASRDWGRVGSSGRRVSCNGREHWRWRTCVNLDARISLEKIGNRWSLLVPLDWVQGMEGGCRGGSV